MASSGKQNCTKKPRYQLQPIMSNQHDDTAEDKKNVPPKIYDELYCAASRLLIDN